MNTTTRTATYHRDVYLPDSLRPSGRLTLRYGWHAADRCREKGVPMLRNVDLARADIVEVTPAENKVVFRVDHPTDPEWDVVVVALTDSGFVKTSWMNRKDDKHSTLKRWMYVAR